MNQEIKASWVVALRSGDYASGVGRLHRVDEVTGRQTYCCLGVLCDLARRAGVVTSIMNAHKLGTDAAVSYGGSTTYLPEEVVRWAELDSTNPVVDGRTLSNLNDQGRSFDAIANLIEEQL